MLNDYENYYQALFSIILWKKLLSWGQMTDPFLKRD